jgi:hypothetical protein
MINERSLTAVIPMRDSVAEYNRNTKHEPLSMKPVLVPAIDMVLL